MKKTTLVLIGGGLLAVLAYFFIIKKKSSSIASDLPTTLPDTTDVPIIITDPNTLLPGVSSTVVPGKKYIAEYIGPNIPIQGNLMLSQTDKIEGSFDDMGNFEISRILGNDPYPVAGYPLTIVAKSTLSQ